MGNPSGGCGNVGREMWERECERRGGIDAMDGWVMKGGAMETVDEDGGCEMGRSR